jgi:hypothetical protein
VPHQVRHAHASNRRARVADRHQRQLAHSNFVITSIYLYMSDQLEWSLPQRGLTGDWAAHGMLTA